MRKKELQTPVLFLIFNRPDVTQEVFNIIRKVKPKNLFVAADGPRPGKSGEFEKCKQTREIIKQVDWDCKIHKLFRGKNLGCKMAVSSAISWFFSNVDSGIILEDDCVPDETFFLFCQELLEYYKDDQRIMHIGGTNVLDNLDVILGNDSYYFSKIPEIWGWATWRRAWEKYNVNFPHYDIFKEKKWISSIFDNIYHQKHWLSWFADFHLKGVDTWDFQWFYTIWINNGLCVLPAKNLVTNIGFRGDATHTIDFESGVANLQASSIDVINHPHFYLVDKYIEKLIMKKQFKTDHRNWYNNYIKCKIIIMKIREDIIRIFKLRMIKNIILKRIKFLYKAKNNN